MREREVQSHVQQKADVFSGNKPTRVKRQLPVAGIACTEETKCMESIDKAIVGMVSKSSGRNDSERKVASKTRDPKGRTLRSWVKAAGRAAN